MFDMTLNTCPVETTAEYLAYRASLPNGSIIPRPGEPVGMRDGRLQVWASDSTALGWYDISADIFHPEDRAVC